MNELQKIVLENQIKIENIPAMTGFKLAYVRQALNGAMKNPEKILEFKNRLLFAIKEKNAHK
jgi:hypothetical protein